MPGYLGDSLAMNRMSIPRIGQQPININEQAFAQPLHAGQGQYGALSAEPNPDDLGYLGDAAMGMDKNALKALMEQMFPSSVGLMGAFGKAFDKQPEVPRTVWAGANNMGGPSKSGIEISEGYIPSRGYML